MRYLQTAVEHNVIREQGKLIVPSSSLNEFPLLWRWTDENYCLFLEAELEQITPLKADSANAAWKKSIKFLDSSSESQLKSSLFRSVETIKVSNEEAVRAWLSEKMNNCKITVSWSPDCALTINTELFIKYWSDFCYPSSDEVTVWPENEAWVIHFSHFEIISFGFTKSV